LITPNDNNAGQEIMSINIIEKEISLADGLQINPTIPYDTREKLRQIFQEFY